MQKCINSFFFVFFYQCKFALTSGDFCTKDEKNPISANALFTWINRIKNRQLVQMHYLAKVPEMKKIKLVQMHYLAKYFKNFQKINKCKCIIYLTFGVYYTFKTNIHIIPLIQMDSNLNPYLHLHLIQVGMEIFVQNEIF